MIFESSIKTIAINLQHKLLHQIVSVTEENEAQVAM